MMDGSILSASHECTHKNGQTEIRTAEQASLTLDAGSERVMAPAQNQRHVTLTKTAVHSLALPVADWPRGK